MASVYAGQLGTGPFATLARSALKREKIAVPIAADPLHDLGFCLVIVDEQGERTFVTSPGAELGLGVTDLNDLVLRPKDVVYVSGYNIVYPAYAQVIVEWLEGLSFDIVLAFDPGPRVADIPAPLLRRVLARTDWLLCNATESLWMSEENSLEKAVYALLATTGRRGVVIHDGAHGCVVATRELPAQRVPGFSVKALDTNGAGDTHNGVFLAELARTGDLGQSARRANAAAAIAVTRMGPASCPTRQEVADRFSEFAPIGGTR